MHARTGYYSLLPHKSLLDNRSNHNQDPLDEDDDKSNRGQSLLRLLTFDDALASMETSRVLGSANDVPHGYSDQHSDEIPSVCRPTRIPALSESAGREKDRPACLRRQRY